MASHLSAHEAMNGQLSRNSSHRKDARGALQGKGYYDNGRTIRGGITKGGPKVPAGWRETDHYKFDYQRRGKKKNFVGGSLPYNNQSHHMLVCEVFYDEKWKYNHLIQVRMSGYDINSADNIIYLPQCFGLTHVSHFHGLPDHSKGHLEYNKQVVLKADKVFDLVEEALSKPCKERPDVRDKVLKALKKIEGKVEDALANAGPVPIGDVL